MSVVTIRDPHTGSTARIAPEQGFNCFAFRVAHSGTFIDVLDAVPGFESGGQRASGSGIPILFPFPNRIRKGRYIWGNHEYVIPGSDKWGNAIHGFCLDRPWRVIDQGPDFVTGQFQLSVDAPDRASLWPADFVLEVTYELIHNRLRASFRISNPSTFDLPWGLGTHPYFKLPLAADSRVEHCTIEAPVSQCWELIDCLPTGKTLPVPPEKDLREGAYVSQLLLDDVYTGVDCDGPQFDCTLIDERAGLQVTQTCPPIFRELVVFTPPGRNAVCIEPYTCPTDAINLAAQGLETGWRTLSPGSEFHTWIDLTAGPVLV